MRNYIYWVLPFAALSLLIFAVLHLVSAAQPPPARTPPVPLARKPFEEAVAGAGLVETCTENIAVGSALAGVVVEVFVPVDKVGSLVKAGDPLFRVDDRQLKAMLLCQKANLLAAEAQLAKLEAMPRAEELLPSEAKVRVAEANVTQQQDLAERAGRLAPSGAMSVEDKRQRQLTFEVARRQLAQARSEHELLRAGAWGPDKAIARAAVAQARAQVERIGTELERTVVRAPVDGMVLQVNVHLGEFVGASPLQTLVVLGNSHKLHVRVDVDEQDISRFVPGTAVTASPRGNSALRYPLSFVRVEPFVVPKKSLTGDPTERVDTRVLKIIYALDTTDRPSVYVGQQMDVFIEVVK